MIKTRISIDPESILFLCSHVHPIIHTYIAKNNTRFFRGLAQSTAVMLQPAYKIHITSIIWYICVFPPSQLRVDVDFSHVHPIIHTYRDVRFSRERAVDRGDATASL